MNLDLPLSEDELDELDAFLMSEAVPEDGMEISTLDGFLAAIVLNPQVIRPSQWLPWVWDMENGEASPEFTDAQQANRILGLLMRHYNTVAKSIDGGWFDPLLVELEQPDGSEFFDAEGWCEGFMLGVSMFQDAWRAVFEAHTELVAPMVLLGTEMGWKMLEERGNNDAATRQAYEAIPAAVAALHEHFRPARAFVQPGWLGTDAAATPGRVQGRSQRPVSLRARARSSRGVVVMWRRCTDDTPAVALPGAQGKAKRPAGLPCGWAPWGNDWPRSGTRQDA